LKDLEDLLPGLRLSAFLTQRLGVGDVDKNPRLVAVLFIVVNIIVQMRAEAAQKLARNLKLKLRAVSL